MKKITNATYLKWYKDMSFWRNFEERCRSLYLKQKISGFLHLYSGQEAIPSGITYVMNLKTDNMITGYRCHILALAMGIDPKKVMAELYGKKTGTSSGLGGSMHIFSKRYRFYGGYGIVGGQIPLGAGIAFADKYFNREAVTVTFLGDGAIWQGALHETFNMSMLLKLPVVYICENNTYAMGTSVTTISCIKNIFKIGCSYDMPAKSLDGTSPLKIAKEVEKAIKRAKNGKGPSFLEILTYRFRGHSMSDPESYRTREEVIEHKRYDPILKIKNKILEQQLLNKKFLTALDLELIKKIDECVVFAEISESPHKNTMYNVVYSQKKYPFLK
ncbi:pyruvate dehydrogenase (acetyl-transferring) E1 component subunit alpha [Candidatus Karelsulcia muelleri]|uniref:pyruvate dehydrogenase (acetyl-transferring) E1 component subunit alpha n=1 Tax=Candidatus Karelsulcia muelleri TaxID=336810 RepID=UPI002363A36C|nr:pyruvate dehydrogenase (acetyl-transferring) E1 component subunit alpha [Candidatus Karelsulcia muelleri]WDE42269.1 pyruvate dehydrogenase (acetyl-transferring) E1 component subunit alpha [Candidatus Karelsulcia muelleri]WDR79118.1 pyruvate dehydrogenase (acetyl-transferring) E1 component subunit alpha [Candidatus Karelsulcia muelleri]